MGRTVAVLNQKGGVGKTTVTLGLASAAAVAGHRVLVVDLDPQAAASWVLGVDPAEVRATSADLIGGATVAEVAVESAWSPSIHLVPAAAHLQAVEHGTPERLRSVLDEVADSYDAILLDCPPSLGNLTTSALTAARHALVVVEPSALGLRGIAGVADVIDEVWDTHNADLELSGVIVNKVPSVSTEADRRYDELTRIVGKRAVWQPVVPHRVVVNQAIGERRPIHSFGSRSRDVAEVFDQLWARVRRTIRRG